jgi:hypothetical protein
MFFVQVPPQERASSGSRDNRHGAANQHFAEDSATSAAGNRSDQSVTAAATPMDVLFAGQGGFGRR